MVDGSHKLKHALMAKKVSPDESNLVEENGVFVGQNK
jgi:hypothetical protein